MSEFIDIYGKVKFIHAVNLNKYGKWSVTVIPTPESLKVIRKLKEEGLKNVISMDDDGEYLTIHREPTKTMRGKVVAFAAPIVVDKDGKPFDGSKIGWGSDVCLRVEVYRNGPRSPYKFVAMRWDKVRVDNLVEFQPDRQWSREVQDSVQTLVNAKEADPW